MVNYTSESFTIEERALLAPYVSNLDRQVFVLHNLPEVVKGALFSRYSRSEKTLRRLLLDEFLLNNELDLTLARESDPYVQTARAEAFYDRVLLGYGDDSVAELAGAHIACEYVSNIATKILEDARIGISPLEKSTRYVRFDRRVGEPPRFPYYIDPRLAASPVADQVSHLLEHLFEVYSGLMGPLSAWCEREFPRDADVSQRAYTAVIRAKACDVLRALLPAATQTNAGLFGNGRAFEYLLTKMYANPLAEIQELAAQIQTELDTVIPSFVKRARNERGRAYQNYMSTAQEEVKKLATRFKGASAAGMQMILPGQFSDPVSGVRLIDYTPDGETKALATMLFSVGDEPFDVLMERVRTLNLEERRALAVAYIGERQSRHHRPGRALEAIDYTFELIADFGAYRDLQRHRMLTQERQVLTPYLGYYTPPEIGYAGLAEPFNEAMQMAARVYEEIVAAGLPLEAQYVLPLGYRLRWYFKINLRALAHLTELRATPQGHPTYRLPAQEMAAAACAVHPLLAPLATQFVDRTPVYAFERLESEKRLDKRLQES